MALNLHSACLSFLSIGDYRCLLLWPTQIILLTEITKSRKIDRLRKETKLYPVFIDLLRRQEERKDLKTKPPFHEEGGVLWPGKGVRAGGLSLSIC